MTNQLIGTRIKALRQAQGLSQDELARLFGFKDRQTVSAIETGIRRITASELLLAMERFGVPLDYFTDPFRLDGECLFSWRQTGVDAGTAERIRENGRTVDRCVPHSGDAQIGRQAPLMRRALGLNRLSRFWSTRWPPPPRFVSDDANQALSLPDIASLGGGDGGGARLIVTCGVVDAPELEFPGLPDVCT